jgi:hypothetical protein
MSQNEDILSYDVAMVEKACENLQESCRQFNAGSEERILKMQNITQSIRLKTAEIRSIVEQDGCGQ